MEIVTNEPAVETDMETPNMVEAENIVHEIIRANPSDLEASQHGNRPRHAAHNPPRNRMSHHDRTGGVGQSNVAQLVDRPSPSLTSPMYDGPRDNRPRIPAPTISTATRAPIPHSQIGGRDREVGCVGPDSAGLNDPPDQLAQLWVIPSERARHLCSLETSIAQFHEPGL